MTTYNYDAVGNLQSFVYPNGVTHAYTYDALNRLTQMGSSKSSTAISNYAYTLGAAGNRTSVAELTGRTVAYAYDSLYRLTTETVTADPNNHNGAINYTYDNVGNRKTLTSTLAPVGGNTYNYDADDRLASDQYDPNGNTTNSLGVANTYDFENHLIAHGGVTVAYDGDGNRVSETVGGVTTNYLVDTQNPTGYAQVVDELVGTRDCARYEISSSRPFTARAITESKTSARILQIHWVASRDHSTSRSSANRRSEMFCHKPANSGVQRRSALQHAEKQCEPLLDAAYRTNRPTAFVAIQNLVLKVLSIYPKRILQGCDDDFLVLNPLNKYKCQRIL